MRFRTFAWTAAAIFVVGINTGILLWLREGRPSAGRGSGGAAQFRPHPVSESPVPTRSPEPGAAEAIAEAGTRILVAVRHRVETTAGFDRLRWPISVLGLVAGSFH